MKDAIIEETLRLNLQHFTSTDSCSEKSRYNDFLEFIRKIFLNSKEHLFLKNEGLSIILKAIQPTSPQKLYPRCTAIRILGLFLSVETNLQKYAKKDSFKLLLDFARGSVYTEDEVSLGDISIIQIASLNALTSILQHQSAFSYFVQLNGLDALFEAVLKGSLYVRQAAVELLVQFCKFCDNESWLTVHERISNLYKSDKEAFLDLLFNMMKNSTDYWSNLREFVENHCTQCFSEENLNVARKAIEIYIFFSRNDKSSSFFDNFYEKYFNNLYTLLHDNCDKLLLGLDFIANTNNQIWTNENFHQQCTILVKDLFLIWKILLKEGQSDTFDKILNNIIKSNLRRAKAIIQLSKALLNLVDEKTVLIFDENIFHYIMKSIQEFDCTNKTVGIRLLELLLKFVSTKNGKKIAIHHPQREKLCTCLFSMCKSNNPHLYLIGASILSKLEVNKNEVLSIIQLLRQAMFDFNWEIRDTSLIFIKNISDDSNNYTSIYEEMIKDDNLKNAILQKLFDVEHYVRLSALSTIESLIDKEVFDIIKVIPEMIKILKTSEFFVKKKILNIFGKYLNNNRLSFHEIEKYDELMREEFERIYNQCELELVPSVLEFTKILLSSTTKFRKIELIRKFGIDLIIIESIENDSTFHDKLSAIVEILKMEISDEFETDDDRVKQLIPKINEFSNLVIQNEKNEEDDIVFDYFKFNKDDYDCY